MKKRIRFLGVLLLLLGSAIVTSGVVLQWKLGKMVPHPQAVAYLGEEKHLVSSVQKSALGLINDNDGISVEARFDQLAASFSEWQQIHHRLVSLAHDSALGEKVLYELREEVFPRFGEIESSVASLVELGSNTVTLSELKEPVKKIQSLADSYLFWLDHLDLHLASAARKQLRDLQYAEATLIIVAGILLLVVVIWLYLPAQKSLAENNERIQRLIEDLRKKNTLLSDLYFKVERKAAHITDCLNTLAHEIRNPLATITMSLELLKEGGEIGNEAATLKSGIARIDRNAHLALKTLGEFLEMTRYEGGLEKLEVEPVLLQELLDSLDEQFRSRAARRNLAFSIEVAPGCPDRLSTDSDKLGRALENLISNAFKYTDEGFVRVLARPHENDSSKICFDVIDSGIGMAPAALEKVFLPFSTPNKRKDSIGLGLTITRRLVEAMEGEIGVESAPGKGTKFTIRIPQDLTTATANSHQTASSTSLTDVHAALSANAHLRGLHVMVVEDNSELRELTADFLRSVGISVMTCSSAVSALATLEKKQAPHFDFILADLNLPGMDGVEFAKEVRRQGIGGTLVAITSYALTYTKSKCRSAGFHDFVEKPLTPLSLAEVLIKHAPREEPPEIAPTFTGLGNVIVGPF